jgi:hypothetical protein
MKVCKYFKMVGCCEYHNYKPLSNGIFYIDLGCPYVSQLGNPTKRQEKCEHYEPYKKETV